MNRTNSNSITSILIYALNETGSNFREQVLDYFKSKTNSDDLKDIYFYDGMHSPLRIKTDKRKYDIEVDIYARKFGEQKVRLIIEIKANLYETLQKSQRKEGKYEKAARDYGCPLLYIIPKNYKHRDKIDQSKIINWEELLEIAKKHDEKIEQQIEHFVEIDDGENRDLFELSKTALPLLNNPKKMARIYITHKNALKRYINTGNIKTTETNFSISDGEFGYYFGNKKFFLGYSYISKTFDDYKGKYELFLNILETRENTILSDKGFYYDGGWYYIPLNTIDYLDIKTIGELKNSVEKRVYCNLDIEQIQKCKKISSVKDMYSVILFIKLLCEKLDIGWLKIQDDFLRKPEYFGYYFQEEHHYGNNIFIGVEKIDDDDQDLYFVFELYKNQKWEKLKFCKLSESYNKFLEAKSTDELNQAFKALVEKAKEKLSK